MDNPGLIDTHCHLESYARKGQLDDVLKRAKTVGVGQVVAIGLSPTDWVLYQRLAKEYPEQIVFTVGLHPCEVKADWKASVDQLLPLYFCKAPTPVGMGEIGLDYFHLPKDLDRAAEIKALQEEAFLAQLELAKALDCPIVIHSRNAFYECLDLIDASEVDWSRVVFHCFAEGPDEIRMLNERGGRGSFTGVITYKNAENVRQAALVQGLENIMIETDAPYLAPVPYRGKPNEPAFVHLIGEFCAQLFQVDLSNFSEKVTANTRHFFKLEDTGSAAALRARAQRTLSNSSIIARNINGLRTEVKRMSVDSGREDTVVRIIVVSKTKPIEAIRNALECQQIDFGENRVQELTEKAKILPQARWHMIGTLQRNKVRHIAPFIHLIHSVDSERLLMEISKQAGKHKRIIDCLIQINISNEEQKSGMQESECERVLETISDFPHVRIIGLMGVAELTRDRDCIRQQFRRLRMAMECFKRFNGAQIAMRELSMGMSDDFDLAIYEGATMIRVGSRIFGGRT